jgi:hypothetical protein
MDVKVGNAVKERQIIGRTAIRLSPCVGARNGDLVERTDTTARLREAARSTPPSAERKNIW